MAALAPLLEPLCLAQAGPSADDAPRSAELALATAAAVASAATHGLLPPAARAAAALPLLRWSAADAADAAAELASAAPAEGDDAQQGPLQPPPVPPLRAAAQAALTAMVTPWCAIPGGSASDAELAATAATAHAWLAGLLRSLAAGSAGWAPRVVADDASAAATAAATALDAAAIACAPPPPPPAGAEPRRLYGLLPPAAPPAAPLPPADAAAGAAADAAAETALRLGVKALAVLLAAEPTLAPAALHSGALTLLARFTAPAPLRPGGGDGAASDDVARQVARAAAVLSLLPAASAPLRQAPWDAWLATAARAAVEAPPPARSGTRKLASHARRAQLNAAAAAPGAPPSAPRFADGLFFFVPTARNLAPLPGSPSCGTAEDVSQASLAADVADAPPCMPGVDVVFVHGLRGGPFGTWRVGPGADEADAATPQRRRAPAALWPADWLAADEPRARVLSLGFRTRYSDWEGATHGLEALADAMLSRLTAAGCGGDSGRPLLLVGHSMGGVLIKLMMTRAAEAGAEGASARTLRGAVFFSCPHFGSRLAELGSWRVLRLAPGVAELRPANAARLEELNDTLRQAHKRAGVRVLSFLEGAPTRLLRVPVFRGRHLTAEVVAMESAYPGFGEMVVLPESDHIDACKPRSRDEPGYERVLAMVREVLAEADAKGAAEGS
jgi:hypothetical protein